MTSLENQVAVVTGAGSGIGKAIALGFAKQGTLVYMADIDMARLKGVKEGAWTTTKGLVPFQLDLEKDEDIHRLVDHVRVNHDGVDLLIHSAGVISVGRIEQASIEDFDLQHRINVRAPYLLTKAFLTALKLRRGQVVFINSSAGLTAGAGVAQYAATKHALKAVADSLRAEINANGVRVISVYPGRTASPMQEALHRLENKAYFPEKLLQPADVAEVVINALTLPRTAEVTDIHVRSMNKP